MKAHVVNLVAGDEAGNAYTVAKTLLDIFHAMSLPPGDAVAAMRMVRFFILSAPPTMELEEVERVEALAEEWARSKLARAKA